MGVGVFGGEERRRGICFGGYDDSMGLRSVMVRWSPTCGSRNRQVEASFNIRRMCVDTQVTRHEKCPGVNCYVCMDTAENASHALYRGDRGHDLTEGRVRCTFLDSCVCVRVE